MRLFRYRTAALVGPWRSSQKEARMDAVRAKQARNDAGEAFQWLVPGEIEERAERQ